MFNLTGFVSDSSRIRSSVCASEKATDERSLDASWAAAGEQECRKLWAGILFYTCSFELLIQKDASKIIKFLIFA